MFIPVSNNERELWCDQFVERGAELSAVGGSYGGALKEELAYQLYHRISLVTGMRSGCCRGTNL